MYEDGVSERDYTGVAVIEMAAVFEKYVDCDIRTFAERIGMEESTLKHNLAGKDGPFIGLKTVDKIVLGLGQDLHTLTTSGELTIIPARGSRNSARRMIEDTLVLHATEHIGTVESARMTFGEAVAQGLLVPPSKQDMDDQITEMIRLRGELALTSSDGRAERMRRDAESLGQTKAEEAA